MSNPGEWINFAELCRRVPGKSATTLRRYIKSRLISHRQLVRGGRMEFNWRTVERELQVLETGGVNAEAAALRSDGSLADFKRELDELRQMVGAIARKLEVA